MTRGAYVAAHVAARRLGVSRRIIARWVRKGQIGGRRECANAHDGEQRCKACRYFVFRRDLEERLREAGL